MYRDNTLIPSEAVRLLALGLLATGARTYSALASDVRHFAGRITGPSLDLVGAPLELLKVEGLAEAEEDPEVPEAEALLTITEAGREELTRLMTSSIRAPVSDLNKLIIALKMRFLHLLEPAQQRVQAEILVEMSEREVARLVDLRASLVSGDGHLIRWLDQEAEQAQARLAWYRELRGKLADGGAARDADP